MILRRPVHLPPIVAVLLAACAVGAVVAEAQIEGPERGVRPVASSGDFSVSGVTVNVLGRDAEDARTQGWRLAQRKAWSMLWARTHDGAPGSLPDSALDQLVSAIVVEQENVGPRRYIARLGVLFDRARAGTILGVTGVRQHSAPLLVLPIQWDGGAPIMFEQQTEWQKAWARFRTADSAIDYVRPGGFGSESLILNAGQIGRRNRDWWRLILDQFGAADVVIPIVRLERRWPGGPIIGHFSARHGPDNQFIGSFDLTASDPDALPQMMDIGVQRMDQLFTGALTRGELVPDRSLVVEQPVVAPVGPPPGPDDSATVEETNGPALSSDTTTPAGPATSITVQFDTPDAGAVDRVLAGVRAVPGVQAATTTSLALGGTSVMRVQYAGDMAALRAALFARGFQVSEVGDGLRLRRAGP